MRLGKGYSKLCLGCAKCGRVYIIDDDDDDVAKMKRTATGRRQPARLLRQVVVASVLCLAVYWLMLGRGPGREGLPSPPAWSRTSGVDGVGRAPPEQLENRSLTQERCRAYFPGLFKEIDDAVAEGPFSLRPRNESGHLGPLIARIRDGKVCNVTRI